MHVQLESKLFPQGVHHLERLFWLLAAVRELSNHGERVVAWRYTSPSHVGKHFQATIEKSIAGTAIEQCVVGDFVWMERGVFLHLLQDSESLVQTIGRAVRLNHCAIGDDVGRHSLICHVLQQRLGPADLATACTNIQQRIVCRHGKLDFLLYHLLVDLPNTMKALLVVEALEDGAVGDCIDQGRGFWICQCLLNDLVGTFSIIVGSQRLHHAA
mmetsp:Transcript_134920/g.190746  ORF Transcript_134920/g.190746 Transcript_134920/m.190746 type:complete len:214 (+) Transcript_134920:531-1172(+)